MNLNHIKIHGLFTAEEAMNHYSFFGDGHISASDIFNFNSNDFDHSSFHELILNGAQAGSTVASEGIHAYNCLLFIATSLNGAFTDCGMGSNCSIKASASFFAQNLHAGIVAAAQLTLGTPTFCEITGLRGTITLAGVTGGTGEVNIYADGAVIIIDNSNSGNTINIYGTAKVTDNSAGTTVNDYTTEDSLANIPTTAAFELRTLPSANYVVVGDTIAGVTACTTNTDMRGTDGVSLVVPDAAGVVATFMGVAGVNLTEIGGDGDHLSAIPDMATATNQGTIAGYIDTEITSIKGKIDDIKAKTDNLPSGVPKNVALSNFQFLMIDSADHVSPKTGLTITAEISKDGGAFAASTNDATEISNGLYKIDFIQAEMNADIVTLKFTATGADQTTITILTSD